MQGLVSTRIVSFEILPIVHGPGGGISRMANRRLAALLNAVRQSPTDGQSKQTSELENEMKLRYLSAATLALSASAMSASAGGLSEVVAPAPVVPVAVAPAPVVVSNDWTGFYAGGSLGYGQLEADGFAEDTEDMTYGVHAGYLYDLGSFVVGGEIEYDVTEITDANTDISLDAVARAKVRAGYDAGALLPYVTAGVAQAYTSGELETNDTGYFAGIGVDYQISPNVRVGAEVLQHRFDDFDDTGTDIEATTAAVRVGFTF